MVISSGIIWLILHPADIFKRLIYLENGKDKLKFLRDKCKKMYWKTNRKISFRGYCFFFGISDLSGEK